VPPPDFRPGMRPVPPPVPPHAARPVPPPNRRMSDFDKTLAVIGAVGTVAAIANSYNSPYYYYRYQRYMNPSVVVYPQRPVVVVEQPVVVENVVETQVVEKVIEKEVIVEVPGTVEQRAGVSPADGVQMCDPPVDGTVIDGADGAYSPKMGASFTIESMQIPGYSFTAARLTCDPVEGSPLHDIGLREGDVITRIGGTPVDALQVLEKHERDTEIRYIKAGTEKVLLATIYIPTDEEFFENDEIEYAP